MTREEALAVLEQFVAQYEPPDALGLVCGEKRALRLALMALREPSELERAADGYVLLHSDGSTSPYARHAAHGDLVKAAYAHAARRREGAEEKAGHGHD